MHVIQTARDSAAVLALWERAIALPAPARADALLAACGDDAPTSLGERNLRLIELHTRLFGSSLTLLSYCPRCGTAAEFEGDGDALAAQMIVAQPGLSHRLEWGSHSVEFRLPQADDIAQAAAVSADANTFPERLLERCLLSCNRDGASVALHELPLEVLDAVSQRMEVLDPAASVCFDLNCPSCAERWISPLDVAHMVWQKLQLSAERLLLEIDALARVYGWSEHEILQLAPLRRAAYLQMAAA